MKRLMNKNWIITSLDSCVDILDNIRKPVNSDERSKRKGEIPYYGATGQVGTIDDYIFNEELVLLGEDAAPFFDKQKNVAYLIKGKAWVNNHAHVLKAKESITINSYLLHYLNFFDYNGYVAGSTRLKLTQASLRRIPVLLPPLAEQKRIVAKLDEAFQHLETLKAKLDRIPELLKKFRETVLTHAVTGKLVSIDNNNVLPLSECLSEIKYGTSQKSDYKVNGVPVLRIPNIKEGEIDTSDLKYSNLDEKERQKLALQDGDILIIRSNGSLSIVGQSAVARRKHVGYTYAGYLVRLRLKSNLNSDYLNYLLKSNYLRSQIEQMARSTTGVNNINTDEIKGLLLPVPPISEQLQIVSTLTKLLERTGVVEAIYNSTKKRIDGISQALLTKAFKGELVPQQENIENSDIFLKQLRKLKNIEKKYQART